MTTIYGLRRVGDSEIRYVGRSDKPCLEPRLRKHVQNAARNYPPKVSGWINEAQDVEIVALAECAADEAARTERAVVKEYHALGHRLTNSHLLPRGDAE